ncbi:urease accessory protein UreH domain-containing protein [Desulfocurvus sp. DL9XJH121]
MDTLFLMALQSSLFLGLIHGINPCGHSWLILAPFMYGERSGRRVFSLTTAFIAGTTAGCLLIGLTLGSVSLAIPASFARFVDLATTAILVVLGLILVIRPGLLHRHDHDHDHDHGCALGHAHCHDHDHGHHETAHAATRWGLFSIGFVNMIVPCPTVAIMYTYALDSGSLLKGTAVFASYALGTGLVLSAVIYAIFKAAGAARALQKDWVEPLVMRTAGVLTIGFGIYSYMASAPGV